MTRRESSLQVESSFEGADFLLVASMIQTNDVGVLGNLLEASIECLRASVGRRIAPAFHLIALLHKRSVLDRIS